MAATLAPAQSDRSDFRTIAAGGARLGVLTAAAVVLFIGASRFVPAVGAFRSGVEALIVLAAGVAVAFLPARWVTARQVEGIAGAAALGLGGTLVFSVIDIVVLRPVRAYPWTWDAIGGGSTWWYLPTWWMLGTFIAWMGAIITAREAARGHETLLRCAGPTVVAAIIAVTVARFAGVAAALPFEAGAAFTILLALLAVVALARRA